MDPNDPVVVAKALEAFQRQKEYHKKYYLRKRGIDLDEIKSRVHNVMRVGPLEAYDELRHAVRGRQGDQHVFFKDGSRTAGAEGWYVKIRTNELRHVTYAETLEPIEWERRGDDLWWLVRPSTIPPLYLESTSCLQAARRRITDIITAGFVRFLVEKDSLSMTIADLFKLELQYMRRERTDNQYVRNDLVPYLDRSIRLCLESINILESNIPNDLQFVMRDVIERGRASVADYIREQEKVKERAIWFRDRVAQEFGYEYNPNEKAFKSGPVRVGLDGQVTVLGKYVCIVPAQYGHGNTMLPHDDIVAAKMIAVATAARNSISTLHPYRGLLDKHFNKGEEKGNVKES